MRWEIKAVIQAVLSRLPNHQYVYRWLQLVTRSNPLDINDQYQRKSGLLKRMREQALGIEGRVFVEIGTGWYPVFPLLLRLLGAERVVTLDLNPWLNRKTLEATVSAMAGILNRVAEDFSVPLELLRKRLTDAQKGLDDPGAGVKDVLDRCGIEYRMPCDARATGLPSQSADYMVSANVLEHVPPDVIRDILSESSRILKPGGYHFHHINPADHFSIGDSRISKVHFLRYSPSAWYFIGGSGVAYHNRLRCVDFVRLFESAPFEIVHTYSHVDERSLAELRAGTARVHPTFQGYTDEQLACETVGIFARNT
jgi:hypothetical protein